MRYMAGNSCEARAMCVPCESFASCEHLRTEIGFPSSAWLEEQLDRDMHALPAPVLRRLSSDIRAGRAVIWRSVEELALGTASRDESIESLRGHQGPLL